MAGECRGWALDGTNGFSLQGYPTEVGKGDKNKYETYVGVIANLILLNDTEARAMGVEAKPSFKSPARRAYLNFVRSVITGCQEPAISRFVESLGCGCEGISVYFLDTKDHDVLGKIEPFSRYVHADNLEAVDLNKVEFSGPFYAGCDGELNCLHEFLVGDKEEISMVIPGFSPEEVSGESKKGIGVGRSEEFCGDSCCLLKEKIEEYLSRDPTYEVYRVDDPARHALVSYTNRVFSEVGDARLEEILELAFEWADMQKDELRPNYLLMRDRSESIQRSCS